MIVPTSRYLYKCLPKLQFIKPFRYLSTNKSYQNDIDIKHIGDRVEKYMNDFGGDDYRKFMVWYKYNNILDKIYSPLINLQTDKITKKINTELIDIFKLHDNKVTLTIMVDVSSTMKFDVDKRMLFIEETRLDYLKKCITNVITNIPENSQINLVTFASKYYKTYNNLSKQKFIEQLEQSYVTHDNMNNINLNTYLLPHSKNKSLVYIFTDGTKNMLIPTDSIFKDIFIKVISIYKHTELEHICKQINISYDCFEN